MPITFNDFLLKAQGTVFGSRDIVVDNVQQAQSVKHGNLIFSSGAAVNDATMAAFKQALQDKYGDFGIHAFDTIVGTRAQLHKSLRACDIKLIHSKMESLKQIRFSNELDRQLDTNPEILKLGREMRAAIRDVIHQDRDQLSVQLKACKNHAAIAGLVDKAIRAAIPRAREIAVPNRDEFHRLHEGEEQIAPDQPMGLSKLHAKATYKRKSTSVEDRVKKGTIGTGLRINDSHSRPAIFEKLKTNGVEPGFIYHNDWSRHDSRSLMINIHSAETKAAIQNIIENGSDDMKTKAAGMTYLEKGLLVGRAHPAAAAFAAEYILFQELDKMAANKNYESPLADSLKAVFGSNVSKGDFFPPAPEKNTDEEPKFSDTQLNNLKKFKQACFVPLRDAVMNYGKTSKEIDPNAQLPVFKHFTDRHILKLDYNEGDRVKPKGAASTGQFRLPERVSIKGGAIQGYFYRKYRLTTADKASVGAVSEAFANDITRMLGIPAQELTLVRGQYSDGHPKIMLEAKFADGYKDLENGFINDGRTQGNVEPLGKYKAIFLALADRDAIGSHGQNKGVINGKFFAIDPGHSLEGNGKFLEIKDNLSFKDTGSGILEKRFRNFSVFDDDTRFHKLQGVLKLREKCNPDDNAVYDLSREYREAFDWQADVSPEEQEIRKQITLNIEHMTREFTDQVDKILAVCDDQLKLYDALGENPATKPLQEDAINTIENLEKFTSPTTWKSENGKVELKHLSVIEETRIPWTAKKVGDTLVYTSVKPLSQDMRTRLSMQQALQASHSATTFDQQGKATITVPIAHAQQFFDAFSEEKVIQLTHAVEAAERENAQNLEN